MQARIIAHNFVLILTIDREDYLDNNIPFWGLCLATKDTHSELCGNTLIRYKLCSEISRVA